MHHQYVQLTFQDIAFIITELRLRRASSSCSVYICQQPAEWTSSLKSHQAKTRGDGAPDTHIQRLSSCRGSLTSQSQREASELVQSSRKLEEAQLVLVIRGENVLCLAAAGQQRHIVGVVGRYREILACTHLPVVGQHDLVSLAAEAALLIATKRCVRRICVVTVEPHAACGKQARVAREQVSSEIEGNERVCAAFSAASQAGGRARAAGGSQRMAHRPAWMARGT